MRRAIRWVLPVGLLAAALAAMGFARWSKPAPLDPAAFAALYAAPLPPPEGPIAVFHLGHSLVGRDMPAMLAQLAGNSYASQLGWGASLKQHWTGEVPGFAEENRPPQFRPAAEAVDSGAYDAVVLTEMVEIRDAVRYHDSADYLARWAARARAANPGTRVYLYETWHRLDDPSGWLDRIDADLAAQWEGTLLRPALARDGVGTIHVIPAGQVMARLVREIEAGRVPGLSRREDLFRLNPDGTQDQIHLNDLGAYAVALVHYAVLTHRNPLGLPYRLTRADGSAADAPTEPAARAMQRIVWDVVRSYPPSGVAQAGG